MFTKGKVLSVFFLSIGKFDAFGRAMDSSYNTESKFLALMARLPQKIRIIIGHKYEDFVKDCTYKGEMCKRYVQTVMLIIW